MALSNTKPASNSSILYPYENPQTDLSKTTEVVSRRLIQSTDSINFIDGTEVPESAILESLDVTSL